MCVRSASLPESTRSVPRGAGLQRGLPQPPHARQWESARVQAHFPEVRTTAASSHPPPSQLPAGPQHPATTTPQPAAASLCCLTSQLIQNSGGEGCCCGEAQSTPSTSPGEKSSDQPSPTAHLLFRASVAENTDPVSIFRSVHLLRFKGAQGLGPPPPSCLHNHLLIFIHHEIILFPHLCGAPCTGLEASTLMLSWNRG